ncbi:MAG: barstar family protein [Candidatus Acidiferrales bacterium]
MREIAMDGGSWEVSSDVYDAFFKAVGAPAWHGRNFNALRDSIAKGRINDVEIPYLIRIKNYTSISVDAKHMAADFVDLIRELHESGVPVDVQVDD